ncbi:hypothetical protein [Paraflavitalea speifideaquila]
MATKCGYGNQNNFSYAFKKNKKMSPTNWQKGMETVPWNKY